jgi:hypothetical protein
MVEFVATASSYLVLGLLVFSGIEHAARRTRFRDVLAEQRVWPRAGTAAVAAVVIATELGIGMLGLLGMLAGPGLAMPALVAASLLFAAYTAYVTYLLRRRPYAPCGCSSGDHPVNAWVAFRSAGLSAGALCGALASDRILAPSLLDERFATAILVSMAFATILWSLPAAVHDPARSAAQ